MSDEARELHRIISASARDMLDAYRIQGAMRALNAPRTLDGETQEAAVSPRA